MDKPELFFGRLGSVAAPEDFERRVLARLALEKERRSRRAHHLRFAYAGAAALVLVGFIVLGLPRLAQRGAPGLLADKDAAALMDGLEKARPIEARTRWAVPASASADIIPVLETLDYGSEVRNLSDTGRTVYILEQISEGRPLEIKY
ncbi:MAG: hypothetical protein OEW05_11630 [Candidatus Aminicenantes bacterium]|nr:hypothetical protein [Candidatus Aminicenantes bacterium]